MGVESGLLRGMEIQCIQDAVKLLVSPLNPVPRTGKCQIIWRLWVAISSCTNNEHSWIMENTAKMVQTASLWEPEKWREAKAMNYTAGTLELRATSFEKEIGQHSHPFFPASVLGKRLIVKNCPWETATDRLGACGWTLRTTPIKRMPCGWGVLQAAWLRRACW